MGSPGLEIKTIKPKHNNPMRNRMIYTIIIENPASL